MSKKLYSNMKDSVKLGIGSMAGLGAIGAMGAVPGMPASPVPGIVGTSVGLANVGQLAKTGMGVAGMFGNGKIKKDKKGKNRCNMFSKHKHTQHNVIRNMI
jgi:hypothetical protein